MEASKPTPGVGKIPTPQPLNVPADFAGRTFEVQFRPIVEMFNGKPTEKPIPPLILGRGNLPTRNLNGKPLLLRESGDIKARIEAEHKQVLIYIGKIGKRHSRISKVVEIE